MPTEPSLDEDALAALLATAEPHHLHDEIPASLRPWLLSASWDRDRLWAIQRPPLDLPIAELRWVYDLPWWRGSDGRWFQVTPRAFLDAPDEHPEHIRRTANADLSYPIHVVVRHGRYFPLDGIHRTLHADQLGHRTIRAILLTLADLPSFLRPAASRFAESPAEPQSTRLG